MDEKIYRSFTDLEVWQRARQYKNEIMDIVSKLPVEEKYRLVDQMVRSSRSIGSNLAEGYGRFTYKEQIHFCMNARGSLFETMNHLIDALDCGYIHKDQFVDFKKKSDDVERLLNGYIS